MNTEPAQPGTDHTPPGPGHRRNRKPTKHLTVQEFCDELGIARSTFYDWRAKQNAPRCIKLPNGEIRIRRAEYERWLDSREEAA